MSEPLALWLWRSAQLEAYAAGIAARLTRGQLVRPEERDYVGDVIFPEELQHRDMLRDLARTKANDLPPYLKVPTLKGVAELDLLMLLTRAEGVTLLDEPKIIRAMRRDNEPEVVTVVKKIADDERGHRAWSRRLIHRMHNDGVHIPPYSLRRFAPFHEIRPLVAALGL